jgi:hypothetical protein
VDAKIEVFGKISAPGLSRSGPNRLNSGPMLESVPRLRVWTVLDCSGSDLIELDSFNPSAS